MNPLDHTPKPAVAIEPKDMGDRALHPHGTRLSLGGCWYMYWRLPRAQFPAQKGEGTKQAFQQVVESGEIVQLLACVKGQLMG